MVVTIHSGCTDIVSKNIAEGDERETDKESVRYFFMAKGSLAELRTQMEIASRIGYISEKTHKIFEKGAIEIGKMIGALIKHRSDQNKGKISLASRL